MDKRAFAIFIFIVAGAFFIGRFTAPVKVRVETKTEYKEVQVKDEAKQTDTTQRIIEVDKPDGTKIKKTWTEKKSSAQKTEQREIAGATLTRKEITTRSGVLINGLLGMDFSSFASAHPVYGLQVSKNVFGPISFGVWGMTNKTFGISLGLEL